MTFPRDALFKLGMILDKQKSYIEREIKNVKTDQSRLPKKFHDYSYYEQLVTKLNELDKKRADHITSKIYFDLLCIIFGGCYIKFGFLDENLDTIQDGSFLKQINCSFNSSVEIQKIVETTKKYCCQIYYIDHDLAVVSILTWDFNRNTEISVVQFRYNLHSDIGYHLVKGMNQQSNYFIDENYLIDVANNIPLRQVNVNQDIDKTEKSYDIQLKSLHDWSNQRKVHFDCQRFLGIEKPSRLYYSLSRMELFLWRNFQSNGHPDLFVQHIPFEMFNIIVDGNTFFHMYSEKSYYIEVLFNRYQKTR